MRYVLDVTAASLVPFVCNVVEASLLVPTDGFTYYDSLTSHSYRHNKHILSTSDSPTHVSMPAVHLVASMLKRWLLGTHQGSVYGAHLQAYLEEYTFRFNRRNSHRHGGSYCCIRPGCIYGDRDRLLYAHNPTIFMVETPKFTGWR
jgi:ISXO2-like transposase domain